MMKSNEGDALTRPAVVACFALIACFLWGSAYPSIKAAYQLFHMEHSTAADKMLFAGIRFTIAGVVILLPSIVKEKRLLRPQVKNLPKVLALALTQTSIQYTFFYVGLANADGSKSSIISSSSVLFSTIFAAIFMKNEKMNTRKILGCMLGLLSIAILGVNASSYNSSFSMNGDFLLLIAAVSFGIASCISKWATKYEDPTIVSSYQLIIGGLILMAVGLAFNGRISYCDWKGALMMLYLIILSSVAYKLWTILLSKNSVASVSIYYSTVPVSGVILSALLLKENILRADYLIAMVLVAAAIIVVNWEKRSDANLPRQ